MTSVLVVDDDAPLGRALARELRANGYDSWPVSGYEEAMQRLSEQRYDVLLTDLRMGDKDGLDLILAIAASFPGTRPILMSAYATARDSERAKELGAVRVLCKPFETSEMLQAVERAVESARGFVGSVHGLSLIDMLQMFHYAQRSLSMQVLGGRPAAIHLRNGQVIHASYGELDGEDALSQILTLPAGSLQTSPLASVTQTVTREFQPLMLDLLRRLDEQRRGLPSLSELAADLPGVASDPGFSTRPSDAGPEVFTPPPSTQVSSATGNELEREREPGLLSDACRRTAAALAGEVVCVVVDLDRARLLGHFATRGDPWARSEALAKATLELFRDAPLQGIGRLLGDGHAAGGQAVGERGQPLGERGQPLRRVELTLLGGLFLARATRQGRRVMALLLGRDADLRSARSQLDAVFPLVEALAP
ncbi:MAG TPA: response regulator [Polyangiaceae bacterium]|nr:response regulator [Polyangiaceae bacterium]